MSASVIIEASIMSANMPDPGRAPMDAEEWARVREILAHALEQPLEQRSRWLDEAYRGDTALRSELYSLLAASDRSAFIDRPAMASSPDLQPGRLIAHYQIVAKIGQGGMGAVYKALDTRLDRPIALKVLARGLGTRNDERRFAREAKAASALNHPNIVTIYEFDSYEGLDYLAMEYIQGVTLATLLQNRDVPLEILFDYARQAATAVARAHQSGIVHRDLKPGNIMVTTDGVVKVLDFGLAKRQSPMSERDQTQTALTIAGTVMGTPSYMSPEQARGESEDWRTDIFSFGVILYEIAGGRRPFDGKNTHAIMYQIVHEEPAALEVAPRVAALIARCMKKDRAQRVQSMDEVAVGLTQLAAGTPASAPAVSRRIWLAGASGIATTAIAAGLWLSHTPLRAIEYTLEAQRYRDGEPVGEVYVASSADTFEGGWKFRLRVRPEQSGFLYLINEGRGDSGTSRYWVLYPGEASGAPLREGQEITTGWYVFDRNPGTEKVWMVLAEHPSDAIDEVLRGNTQGEVKEPAQANRIRDFLTGLKRPVESAAPGRAGAIQWRAAGGTLGGAIELRHK